jgi:membrane-bound lytic murein transglycosylase D
MPPCCDTDGFRMKRSGEVEASMLRWCGSAVLCVMLSIILVSGCATLSSYGVPSDEGATDPAGLKASRASGVKHPLKRANEVDGSSSSDAVTKSGGEAEDEASPADGEGLTNQELIDSALEFCQASNDYWERGDLDNALAALDKAYSLILRVDEDDDPDLLQQKEDLRFTISKRIVQVYASRFTVAAGDHNAIPLVMNDYVARELASFKGRERDFFMAAYSRSGKFRPAIVKALREAGMPEELSWLPLIESGFKVRALSRARALGMWQFIASTGYRFGLKRDQWVDERMDARKSTVAAIAYLKELHQMFGDWTTALAAYNCGEMAVMNRIRAQRINYLDNFWDLYTRLPSETAAYVPRFLAVLHIVNDPAAHGMDLPSPEPELVADEVAVQRQVRTRDVAAKLGVDPNTLEEMNAELRHDVTPDAPYVFKVPAGKGRTLLAMIDEIPTHSLPTYAHYGDMVIHRVKSGDTLSTIARKYRSSVPAIMAENGIRKNHILRVGTKLKVPTKGGAGRSVKVAQSAAKRGNEGEKANREKSDPRKTYTVQGGDTPYLIAKRHEMELSDFLELNNLTPESTIFPGQTFAIKGD